MVIKLKDMCDVRDGTHDSPTYVVDGYPLVTSKNIVDGKLDLSVVGYVSQEDYNKINERSNVDDGDIIMPMIGTIGNPCLVQGYTDFAIKNVALIKFPDDRIKNKYILYFLKSNAFKRYVASKNKGGTQKFLSLGDIRNIEIPRLSTAEQEEIICCLEKMESVIKLREQELEQLDNLIKSRFVEMFGQPFDTTRWIVKELKDISESMIDGSNVNPDYYELEGEVLFLRIQNVWRNEFRLEDSVYISQEINRKSYYDTSLKTGDLLITKIGRYYTKDSSLGRVSVYRGEDDSANYSNNIMCVRLSDCVNSEFVNVLLNLDDYQLYIRRTSKGGTDKRALSKALIGSYPIIIPPRVLQDEFVELVTQVDKLKFEVQKSLDETQTLMDSLMQQYFG